MPAQNIVIDTNVVVSAVRSRQGASSKLLSLMGTNLFEFHLSVPLVLEYEEVLQRQQPFHGLSDEDIFRFVDALCNLGIKHEIYYLWRPQLKDFKDDFILELAIAARCEAIVTFNLKDFVGIEPFGLRVLTPQSFLTEIGGLS
ncbi:MAG: putative toxin-antitoxin system toxin component, PIN family [Ardenticatenaceae bacterium]|nr:putative toxin-antitoxin system toxin component, PIN family [Ardenticatenaceae bacterium]